MRAGAPAMHRAGAARCLGRSRPAPAPVQPRHSPGGWL